MVEPAARAIGCLRGQERSFLPQDNIPVPELIAYLEIQKSQFLPGLFSGRLTS